MSKKKKAAAAPPPVEQPQAKGKNRTVKVPDDIHHRIRVLSVQARVPMQHLIKQLLLQSLENYKAAAGA
jgi:hypothetical protein